MQDIRQFETVRYFVSPAGRLVPAPDNRVTAAQCGYRGWRTCDAKGVKEIETLSMRLAQQWFEHRKTVTAQQYLREQAYREQKKAGYRLAIARNYSDADVQKNRELLERMEAREEMDMRALLATFDATTRNGCFEMEMKEASPASKREGIAA